jgi:hypothetical protein
MLCAGSSSLAAVTLEHGFTNASKRGRERSSSEEAYGADGGENASGMAALRIVCAGLADLRFLLGLKKAKNCMLAKLLRHVLEIRDLREICQQKTALDWGMQHTRKMPEKINVTYVFFFNGRDICW